MAQAQMPALLWLAYLGGGNQFGGEGITHLLSCWICQSKPMVERVRKLRSTALPQEYSCPLACSAQASFFLPEYDAKGSTHVCVCVGPRCTGRPYFPNHPFHSFPFHRSLLPPLPLSCLVLLHYIGPGITYTVPLGQDLPSSLCLLDSM